MEEINVLYFQRCKCNAVIGQPMAANHSRRVWQSCQFTLLCVIAQMTLFDVIHELAATDCHVLCHTRWPEHAATATRTRSGGEKKRIKSRTTSCRSSLWFVWNLFSPVLLWFECHHHIVKRPLLLLYLFIVISVHVHCVCSDPLYVNKL